MANLQTESGKRKRLRSTVETKVIFTDPALVAGEDGADGGGHGGVVLTLSLLIKQ